MNFAAIEAATAASTAALFSNIHPSVGAYALDATLTRGVEQIGERETTGARRRMARSKNAKPKSE